VCWEKEIIWGENILEMVRLDWRLDMERKEVKYGIKEIRHNEQDIKPGGKRY
jgi:hypothetical protein